MPWLGTYYYQSNCYSFLQQDEWVYRTCYVDTDSLRADQMCSSKGMRGLVSNTVTASHNLNVCHVLRFFSDPDSDHAIDLIRSCFINDIDHGFHVAEDHKDR